jgi:hypothetical protein
MLCINTCLDETFVTQLVQLYQMIKKTNVGYNLSKIKLQ